MTTKSISGSCVTYVAPPSMKIVTRRPCVCSTALTSLRQRISRASSHVTVPDGGRRFAAHDSRIKAATINLRIRLTSGVQLRGPVDRRLGFPVRPRGPRQLQRRVRGLPPHGGTPPRTVTVVGFGARALGEGRACASSALAAEQRATPDQIRLRSGHRDRGGCWIDRLRAHPLHLILAA